MISYFCKVSKEKEENLVSAFRLSGLWDELSAAINLVAYYRESLLYSVNNNCTDAYNSVVSKICWRQKNKLFSTRFLQDTLQYRSNLI